MVLLILALRNVPNHGRRAIAVILVVRDEIRADLARDSASGCHRPGWIDHDHVFIVFTGVAVDGRVHHCAAAGSKPGHRTNGCLRIHHDDVLVAGCSRCARVRCWSGCAHFAHCVCAARHVSCLAAVVRTDNEEHKDAAECTSNLGLLSAYLFLLPTSLLWSGTVRLEQRKRRLVCPTESPSRHGSFLCPSLCVSGTSSERKN